MPAKSEIHQNLGFNCFRYNGSQTWNNLPNNIKDALSIKEFKTLINKWKGAQCLCSLCIIIYNMMFPIAATT